VRKTLAPSSEREVAASMRKVRKCKTHPTMCEAKKKKNKKSV